MRCLFSLKLTLLPGLDGFSVIVICAPCAQCAHTTRFYHSPLTPGHPATEVAFIGNLITVWRYLLSKHLSPSTDRMAAWKHPAALQQTLHHPHRRLPHPRARGDSHQQYPSHLTERLLGAVGGRGHIVFPQILRRDVTPAPPSSPYPSFGASSSRLSQRYGERMSYCSANPNQRRRCENGESMVG